MGITPFMTRFSPEDLPISYNDFNHGSLHVHGLIIVLFTKQSIVFNLITELVKAIQFNGFID